MSIALMTAVWKLDLAPSDKMVLLALADAANDDGVTWMAVKSRNASKLDLLKKCSLSERAVQGALKRLCEGGHLSREDRIGKGVVWTVTPAASAPPQDMRPAASAGTPAASAGKPSLNLVSLSEAKASSERAPSPRGHTLPDGWVPNPDDFTKALDLIGPERAATELEKFSDYWRAVPGAKGRKLDWSATYRNWIRRTAESAPRNAKSDKLAARHDNYAASWTGADGAADLMAARRAF